MEIQWCWGACLWKVTVSIHSWLCVFYCLQCLPCHFPPCQFQSLDGQCVFVNGSGGLIPSCPKTTLLNFSAKKIYLVSSSLESHSRFCLRKQNSWTEKRPAGFTVGDFLWSSMAFPSRTIHWRVKFTFQRSCGISLAIMTTQSVIQRQEREKNLWDRKGNCCYYNCNLWWIWNFFLMILKVIWASKSVRV